LAVVDRLTAFRGPAKSYSDVILRLVEMRWRRSLALHNPTPML
jgi:predicted CopG family antitoxin